MYVFVEAGGRTFCRGNRDWIRETRSIGGLASGVVSRIREFVEVYRDRGSNAVKRASNACVVGEKNKAQRVKEEGTPDVKRKSRTGRRWNRRLGRKRKHLATCIAFSNSDTDQGGGTFQQVRDAIQEIGRISRRVVYRNGLRQ